MIPILWIVCGIILLVQSKTAKKNSAKLLASKARQRKSNLSDEEYIATVEKTNKILGILVIILGVIWIITIH